jgi:orotidine-5'-phosphate decarboxylase
MEPKEKLIYALDGLTVEEASVQIAELKNDVGIFKIGLELYVQLDRSFMNMLYKQEIPYFLDLKLHDIPRTMLGCLNRLYSLRPKFVTMHLDMRHSENMETMKPLIEEIITCQYYGMNILAITYLTCYNQNDLLAQIVPSHVSIEEYALSKAIFAIHDMGCAGVVSSVSTAGIIKTHCKDSLVVCPGISPEWANKKANYDQKRTATVDEAIRQGADYIVVGSAIRHEGKYTENAFRIVTEIKEAMNKYGKS